MFARLKASFIPQPQQQIKVQCANALNNAALSRFEMDPLIPAESIGRIGVGNKEAKNVTTGNTDNFEEEDKKNSKPFFDVIIHYAVRFAGTIHMFILLWALLIAWIIWGCIKNGPDQWQIVMQDGQSIQTYVWDTFLMRQQLDDTEGFLTTYGKLKSRNRTIKRLIEKMITNEKENPIMKKREESSLKTEYTVEYKSLTYFDRLSNKVSNIMGSVTSISFYWIGIFIWVGMGAYPILVDGKLETWSDKWQMTINTATAVELLVTSVFLQNIRTRNNDLMRNQLEIFDEFDAKLELLTRYIMEDDTPNPEVIVQHCPREGIEWWISKYSDIIGTGIGLIISIIVFAIWIGIGPVMSWNDDWWLIIGTYTGLVGFIDGFILREVFFKITEYEESKFYELLEDSHQLLDLLSLQYPTPNRNTKKSTLDRISETANKWCSCKWAVLSSVFMVIILLIISSVLKWSTTGQLIANTPTMIIEGFFLLFLIRAHNWADKTRRIWLEELTIVRAVMVKEVERRWGQNL